MNSYNLTNGNFINLEKDFSNVNSISVSNGRITQINNPIKLAFLLANSLLSIDLSLFLINFNGANLIFLIVFKVLSVDSYFFCKIYLLYISLSKSINDIDLLDRFS